MLHYMFCKSLYPSAVAFCNAGQIMTSNLQRALLSSSFKTNAISSDILKAWQINGCLDGGENYVDDALKVIVLGGDSGGGL